MLCSVLCRSKIATELVSHQHFWPQFSSEDSNIFDEFFSSVRFRVLFGFSFYIEENEIQSMGLKCMSCHA